MRSPSARSPLWAYSLVIHARRPRTRRLVSSAQDRSTYMSSTYTVAATIYVDDVYVERAFAEETAKGVRGLRPWITNEYAHNGLRADGERVVGRLLDMVRGLA